VSILGIVLLLFGIVMATKVVRPNSNLRYPTLFAYVAVFLLVVGWGFLFGSF